MDRTHKESDKRKKYSKKYIEQTITNPDKIVTGVKKRKIYQKILGNRLLRVVTDNNVLITAYFTDKISKFMGE